MLPIVQVGPVALQVPGLAILAGIWVGTWLAEREASRRGVSATSLNAAMFTGLVSAVLAARLWYAARYLDVYLAHPLALAALDLTTLEPFEGVGTGALAFLIVAQRRRLSFWPTLDSLTPGLAAFAIFVGLAHLASGDAFGAPAQLPWSVFQWGEWRHPSQAYETALAALTFLVVLRFSQRPPFPGFVFLAWLAVATAGRVFLEGFRGDSALMTGGIRSAQVISLAILAFCMVGLHWRSRATLPDAPGPPGGGLVRQGRPDAPRAPA